MCNGTRIAVGRPAMTTGLPAPDGGYAVAHGTTRFGAVWGRFARQFVLTCAAAAMPDDARKTTLLY